MRKLMKYGLLLALIPISTKIYMNQQATGPNGGPQATANFQTNGTTRAAPGQQGALKPGATPQANGGFVNSVVEYLPPSIQRIVAPLLSSSGLSAKIDQATAALNVPGTVAQQLTTVTKALEHH